DKRRRISRRVAQPRGKRLRQALAHAAGGGRTLNLRKPKQAQPVSATDEPPEEVKAASPALPAVSARRLAAITRENNEFLPAALEIIASPASPIRIALLWFICAFVSAALAWSYFSKIDIYAVADGKIQPSGRSKIVQPFEAGK